MSDYLPSVLSAKWSGKFDEFLRQTRQLWNDGRPRRRLFDFGLPENDSGADEVTPRRDLKRLAYEGTVVFGHFTRAYFPAYISGTNTHYGSVVYSSDPDGKADLFDLAWRINVLREGRPPKGTEKVAAAIQNDRSQFARLELPAELGAPAGCYFANLCIHRTRLPLGYIHSRLVPLLIARKKTSWCCLLPLRFWSPEMRLVWESGAPLYNQAAFEDQCRRAKIIP